MTRRECQQCGCAFEQTTGRAAKRCPGCRSRYGTEFRRIRREIEKVGVAGTPCTRCGKALVDGEPWDLDHDDDTGRIAGPAHQRCNRSAGTARGNRMRAAAYRASKGLPEAPQRPSGGRLKPPPRPVPVPVPEEERPPRPGPAPTPTSGGWFWSDDHQAWCRASRTW